MGHPTSLRVLCLHPGKHHSRMNISCCWDSLLHTYTNLEHCSIVLSKSATSCCGVSAVPVVPAVAPARHQCCQLESNPLLHVPVVSPVISLCGHQTRNRHIWTRLFKTSVHILNCNAQYQYDHTGVKTVFEGTKEAMSTQAHRHCKHSVALWTPGQCCVPKSCCSPTTSHLPLRP